MDVRDITGRCPTGDVDAVCGAVASLPMVLRLMLECELWQEEQSRGKSIVVNRLTGA